MGRWTNRDEANEAGDLEGLLGPLVYDFLDCELSMYRGWDAGGPDLGVLWLNWDNRE